MQQTTQNNMPGAGTSSVFVALVGRPNVGKSSLTNRLVGEKVAIVTQKPQTTRSRITGILTRGPVQYVLMDTPGIHAPRNKLDARMTQTAAASVKDVDVTVMLFEPAGELTESERTMIETLGGKAPAIAVINKVDISALICCERKSHKGMIIGKGGQMLKKISTAARLDCEELLGVRINLRCFVKVMEGWRNVEHDLNELGFKKP